MTSRQAAGLDLPGLCDIAAGILDEAAPEFVAGLGAPSAVDKGGNDFATQVDLDLELSITAKLNDRTGIPVHGEEFGGPDTTRGTTWVIDPIDGTVNYSAGLPMSCMMLALLRDGVPLIGLTWLPIIDRRYTGYLDAPLRCNGEEQPQLAPVALRDRLVGFGAFNARSRGRFRGDLRADVLRLLSSRAGRLRMSGSTGVDMAFTAAGMFGGAVAFSRHPWDNAAGAALVRSAGGVATDLAGREWTAATDSLVCGAPGLHTELMEVITETTGDAWADLEEEDA